MRVLLSSTWGIGHVLPMVPLARALLASGHEVLWATSADGAHLVEAAGVRAAPAGLAGQALRDRVGPLHRTAATLPPRERAAFMFPEMFGATLAPAMLPDLLALARGWRPDLLVHEHGELAAPLVAAVLGVPSVVHAFGGAVPEAFVAAAGERLAPLREAQGLPPAPYAGCFGTLYLDICPPSVQGVPLSHVPSVQALRPEPEPPRPLPDGLVADGGPPLVYVTLGTVQGSAAVLRPVVDALAGLPVRLLVAVGPGGDPEALGDQPAHVRVERWVPQADVLRRSAAVVSHAGSGTFLGALAEGLPQLCLPQAADQFRNAAAGVRAGAALVLEPGEATPAAVARAVTRLLSEPSLRTGAERVADEVRRMPSPEEVAGVLARLVG